MKVIFFMIVGCLITLSAEAELNLAVEPYAGGDNLRFGLVGSASLINKEVKLKITSTGTNQYQVFQRVISPFINEKGVKLNMDALTAYTLRGSNAKGALYQEEPVSLSDSDQLLYTSDTSGTSDSFFVVYTISGASLNAQGNFLGKVLYTLRSIGGSAEQTYILDLFLNASGDLKVEAKSPSGRDSVRLSTKSDKDEKSYLRFSFKGNLGKELRVYQEAEQFPQDELNQRIGGKSFSFFLSGGDNGEAAYQSPVPLEEKRVLIYSSQSNEDTFFVNFRIDKEAAGSEKAGSYKGKLKYLIEEDGAERVIFVDLNIEITPVFKLETVLPPGGLNFPELLPDSPAQFKEVLMKVKSNLGRPYAVIHKLSSSLTNERGEKIPQEYFMIKEEVAGGASGRVEFSDYRPVPLGETPIFFSDNKGSPAQFKVTYRLKAYSGITYGNYFTSLSYSLQEM